MKVGDYTFNGNDAKTAKSIIKLKDTILNGTLLAIDPASKSVGYAVFEKGELHISGSYKASGSIGPRLKEIGDFLVQFEDPDVLAIEKVRTHSGHHMLTWGAGHAVGAVGAETTIEITCSMWKKVAGAQHIKSDENDAIAIGELVLYICREG